MCDRWRVNFLFSQNLSDIKLPFMSSKTGRLAFAKFQTVSLFFSFLYLGKQKLSEFYGGLWSGIFSQTFVFLPVCDSKCGT